MVFSAVYVLLFYVVNVYAMFFDNAILETKIFKEFIINQSLYTNTR